MSDPYDDQLTEDDWESMLDAARVDEAEHPDDYAEWYQFLEEHGDDGLG